ncbi:hypothetical protein EXU48_15675 [Occultella glacieicola]|uniref:Uncharacterized protein n=1 Tax=Occultella glacieicola TaxID=2518684 RepID=A0ABY2E0V8_9MICO|nr:hypothetical protein [Occultella glacieicola]TDE91584.1 hypothetical protein EXU48_15675 [Occultella glacieicola]
MTTMKIAGTLLATDAGDRTLTYLLAPFGEPGRTNLGKVTLTASSFTVPEDVTDLGINVEHERTTPVAKFARVEATDAGYEADVRFLATRAGDDALTEAREGVRKGISVEVDQPVIRDGKMLAGLLSGAGLCVTPAFTSAQLVAADAGELPDHMADTDSETVSTETITIDGKEYVRKTTSKYTSETTPVASADDPTEGDDEGDNTMGDTTLAASAPAGGPAAMRGKSGPKIDSAESLFATLAKAFAADDRQMLAALDQGIAADLASAQQPQWAGEVWARRTHRQRFIPLFTSGPLNALKITGWKFAPRSGTAPQPPATPTVATYAGYPAEPNSTEVKTGPVTITASRLAGANEFDRAFVDFDTPEFWAGFFRESANDLSRKLDTAAETHLFTSGNYVEVDGGTVPSGVSTAAAYIVDGVLAIQDVAVPDFAVIGVDLWREFALTRKDDALEYLSAMLGLDPAEGRFDTFKFIPSSHASVAGSVLVGASDSHTFYGPKTVRASTVDIAKGGVVEGLFGYYAANTGSDSAFALVAAAA